MDYIPRSSATLERLLKESIISLQPSNSETSLDEALILADGMLSNSNNVNEIIIFSDGDISDRYDESVKAAKSLEDVANIYFLHTVLIEPQDNNLPKQFASEVGG
ncbi:MAG: hypothetical protein R2741_01500 [Methanolobus sp.]